MPNQDNAERLSISLPSRLVKRIDEMTEQLRQDHPYRNVTRSGLIGYLLSEHITLLDEPAHEIAEQPAPEHPSP